MLAAMVAIVLLVRSYPPTANPNKFVCSRAPYELHGLQRRRTRASFNPRLIFSNPETDARMLWFMV
jgi:hypothetical protein